MHLRTGLIAAAMASTLLLGGAGIATADSGAQGGAANSPGVLSGNAVQAPVDLGLNLCGNSIDAIGALNPAFGNSCKNA